MSVNYLLEHLKPSPALRHELCKGRQGALGDCWTPAGDDLTDNLHSQRASLSTSAHIITALCLGRTNARSMQRPL